MKKSLMIALALAVGCFLTTSAWSLESPGMGADNLQLIVAKNGPGTGEADGPHGSGNGTGEADGPHGNGNGTGEADGPHGNGNGTGEADGPHGDGTADCQA